MSDPLPFMVAIPDTVSLRFETVLDWLKEMDVADRPQREWAITVAETNYEIVVRAIYFRDERLAVVFRMRFGIGNDPFSYRCRISLSSSWPSWTELYSWAEETVGPYETTWRARRDFLNEPMVDVFFRDEKAAALCRLKFGAER